MSETGSAEAATIQVSALSNLEIIKKFGQNPKAADTGCPEVQIALLTKRIEQIAGHVKSFKMDNHSARGMMQMISNRKRLLAYLKTESIERYRKTISALGLRK